MTYEEVIDKIHNLNRFGSKLGLERIEKLMDLLGNPQNKMKVIHVAGTNGKGSVSRYLSTVLIENGYHVGLYTSPFLERFSERMEFDGEEISKEDLVLGAEEVFSKVDIMISEGLDSPTEFEVVTAIAFCYFQNKKSDFVVLEVGLGGRGDSTNIIEKPVATVITSISYDHMEYLGDTLEKIAIEKAGILKPGVPMISNVKDQIAADVIKRMAEEKGCPHYGMPLAKVKNLEKDIEGYSFDVKFSMKMAHDIETKSYVKLCISMIGMHQVDNAVCALSVMEVLRKEKVIKIEDEKVYAGMKKAKQAGRLEVLCKNPYLILDGAHNEAGAQALKEAIKELFPNAKILMVIGMLADKEITEILEQFCQISDNFVATEPDNPRKFNAEILCQEVQAKGKNCIAIPDAIDACQYLEKNKENYDLIVVAGSLYLIGAVRGKIKTR